MNLIRFQPQGLRRVVFDIIGASILFSYVSIGLAASMSPTIDEYVTLLRSSQEKHDGSIDSSMGKVIEQADKTDPVTQVNLGIALTRIKNYSAAINVLSDATKLAPQNTLAYANLGYASYWSNDCDKAMPAFNKAIELDANHAESGHWHSLAGMCYIRLKDYTNAERYCEKALFLLPAQPRGALCLGKAQFGAKQYEAAISSFLRAYNMTTDSFYKGESQDGVLASLSKQNRLDLAANLLKLTPESLWTKEFIEKSATKAVSSLEHGERWQY